MLREITRLLTKTLIFVLKDISEDYNRMSYADIYEEVSNNLPRRKKLNEYMVLIEDYLAQKPAKTPQHISRVCLRSLLVSLKTYRDNAAQYKFVLALDPGYDNIFSTEKKESPHDLTAIQRLQKFGKTNINYNTYLRYGKERILNDLRDCGIKSPSLYIAEDSHEPLEYVQNLYSSDYGEYAFFIPVMPLVIIQTSEN